MDFGVAQNAASSYAYACYRNGVAIPGASGTATSRLQTYIATSSDSGTVLSCRFTPSNSYGTGSLVAIGGIYVN